MLDDHLPIEVWYPRKQVFESSISLCVDLFLCFGDRFGLPRIGSIGGELFLAESRSSLFDNRLAYVMSDTMQVDRKLLVVSVLG